jgi:hypothetical protein
LKVRSSGFRFLPEAAFFFAPCWSPTQVGNLNDIEPAILEGINEVCFGIAAERRSMDVPDRAQRRLP